METVRAPENHPDIEAAVLGAVMISNESLLEVVDVLNGECFYSPANRLIYEKVVISLYSDNKAIDVMTIVKKLTELNLLEKIGGAYYVASLTNKVAGATNLLEHALILKQSAIKREIGKLGDYMYGKSFDPAQDPLDLLSEVSKRVDEVGLKVTTKPFTRIDKMISDNLIRIEEVSKISTDLTGVPSGFRDLDRITHGFQKTDLIILGARPGMGKTTLALNFLKNAAVMFGHTVAFFSLEMSLSQVTDKLMSAETGIPAYNIQHGRVTEQDWEVMSNMDKLIGSNILVDDQAGISMFELKTKARRLKNDNPDLAFIVIDYLQLITMGNEKKGNREQEISYISSNLKGLAKDIDVPIVALSQLSRAVDSRPDKIPQLSDLRDSGSIEQDADMVMFLYRPEYYKIMLDEAGESLAGKARLMIEKNRKGSLDTVDLHAALDVSRFENEQKPF